MLALKANMGRAEKKSSGDRIGDILYHCSLMLTCVSLLGIVFRTETFKNTFMVMLF